MIKRTVLFLIALLLLLSLFSCNKTLVAEELLEDFLYVYGVSGVVYSPSAREWEDGYAGDGLMQKIYVYDGEFPQNYALLLNSRADRSVEAAVFVCDSEYECTRVMEMCLERLKLISGDSSEAYIYRSSNIIFYSTFDDDGAVEDAWIKIIKSHT